MYLYINVFIARSTKSTMFTFMREYLFFHSVHHNLIYRTLPLLFIAFTLFHASHSLAQQNPVIDSLESVLAMAKEDENKVDILNALSWQYYRTGDSNRSKLLADEALSLAENLNYNPGIALSCKNMGNLLSEWGENSEAMNAYVISLKISEDIGDKTNMANCYYNIAMVYA
jgi:tetratricopeptide (TPR) repeat protein